MGQRIREIMTSNPSTVEHDQPVVEAARIMKQEDAGVVPVTENGRLAGMVTDRDIAIRVVAEGKDPQSTTVREVASTDLVTVDPQQELDEALRLMAQHKVRRLPVVEETADSWVSSHRPTSPAQGTTCRPARSYRKSPSRRVHGELSIQQHIGRSRPA
jgi:CBS domain-containing protein